MKFTILLPALAAIVRPWQGAAMSRPAPAAGGFFLVIAIMAGFVIGMLRGNPLGGTLIGTVVGIAAATILWIVDRRRAGR